MEGKLNTALVQAMWYITQNRVSTYESIKLNDNATVFQAKITAIQRLAEYLFSSTAAEYVKILVNSQATLVSWQLKDRNCCLLYE
jgi:hypothetical protein